MSAQQPPPVSPPGSAPISPPPYSTAVNPGPIPGQQPIGVPAPVSPGQPLSPGSVPAMSSPQFIPTSAQAPPFNHSVSMPQIPQYSSFQPGSPPNNQFTNMNAQHNPNMMLMIMTPNGPMQVSGEQIRNQVTANAIQPRPVQLPDGSTGYELVQTTSAPPALNMQPVTDASAASRTTFSHKGTLKKLYHPLTTAKEVMQHGTVRKATNIVGVVSNEAVAFLFGVNVLKDVAVIQNSKMAREKNKQAKQQAAQQSSQQQQQQQQHAQPQQQQQPQPQPQQYQAQLGSPNMQTLQYVQSSQVHMLQGSPYQQHQPQMQPMYYPLQNPQGHRLSLGPMVPSALGQVPVHPGQIHAGQPWGQPAPGPGNVGQMHAPNLAMNQAQMPAANGIPFVNTTPSYGVGQSQVHLQSSRMIHTVPPVPYAMAYPGFAHPSAMFANSTMGLPSLSQNVPGVAPMGTAPGQQTPGLAGNVNPPVPSLQRPPSVSKLETSPEGSTQESPAAQHQFSQPVTTTASPHEVSQPIVPESSVTRSPTSPHRVPRKPLRNPTVEDAPSSPDAATVPQPRAKSPPRTNVTEPAPEPGPSGASNPNVRAATIEPPTDTNSRPNVVQNPLPPQSGLPSVVNVQSTSSMAPTNMPRMPMSMNGMNGMNSLSSAAMGIQSVLGIGTQLESLNLMHHQDQRITNEMAPSSSQMDPSALASAASTQASAASTQISAASTQTSAANTQDSAASTQDPTLSNAATSSSTLDASQSSAQVQSQADWSDTTSQAQAQAQAQAAVAQGQDPSQSISSLTNSSMDPNTSYQYTYVAGADPTQQQFVYYQMPDQSQSQGISYQDPSTAASYAYADQGQNAFWTAQPSCTSYSSDGYASMQTPVQSSSIAWDPSSAASYATYQSDGYTSTQTPVQDSSTTWTSSSTAGISSTSPQYDYGSQDNSAQDQTSYNDAGSSDMSTSMMDYSTLDACASMSAI